MVEFTELKDVQSANFTKAIAIYEDSLPATERQTANTIKERVASRKERLFIGLLYNEVVMMALVWPLKDTEFVLFDYMAVKKECRNLGIGAAFVRNILQITGMADKTFVLEIEAPEEGDDLAMRKRRIEFYRRNGAKTLKNIQYLLPPLQGDLPTQMTIMVISQKSQTFLNGNVVKALFRQIYRDLYSRDETDPLLVSFVDLVPAKVYIV
jgi:GNAT superfamily N-acetyltransferase